MHCYIQNIRKKMKTMFPSQENTKKKFQKPNILRKKSKKPPKQTLNRALESHDRKFLCKTGVQGVDENVLHLESADALYPITQSDLDPVEIEMANINYGIPEINEPPSEQSNLDFINRDSFEPNKGAAVKSEETSSHALVNIESFFNESAGEKYMLFDVDYEPGKQIETVVLIDNEPPQNEVFTEQGSDIITDMGPLSEAASAPQEADNEVTNTSNFPNLYSPFMPMVKYKCDMPNCTKEFRSEQKYKKHKNSHNKDGTIKAPRQVTVECPVKKLEEDGTEKACGKIFLVRELLLKHLNEEHTPDDAVYRCEECGRRFFWASGLRAHGRAHWRAGAGAGALACGWPGCGRVFRQPCRLREHARAHTGDRPYPCQYPNCGWSFRSASKLVRHARRHTGERRHACAACGRAFRRREHLRDHAARHHAPPRAHPAHPAPRPTHPAPSHAPRAARRARACLHPGCEQTFNNMSTLYMHMKRVHKTSEAELEAATPADALYTVPDNMFMVSLAPEAAAAAAEGEGGADAAGEWHSARTHCTWPLERAALRADPMDEHLLKDDGQVEHCEGSESTFTVRSDLFLHGNVLINEDSEHMGAYAGGAEPELGLLDAHPTIDLMQEELMYADTAADESSFRIFLLSGEELT